MPRLKSRELRHEHDNSSEQNETLCCFLLPVSYHVVKVSSFFPSFFLLPNVCPGWSPGNWRSKEKGAVETVKCTSQAGNDSEQPNEGNVEVIHGNNAKVKAWNKEFVSSSLLFSFPPFIVLLLFWFCSQRGDLKIWPNETSIHFGIRRVQVVYTL